MRTFVDTGILIRHLTGDPPDLAARATRFLREAHELLLADLVVAEVVHVLESFYEPDRLDLAETYLVARAERSAVGVVASFDRSNDRAATRRQRHSWTAAPEI